MSKFIDSIEVKSPCSEDWDEMTGDAKTRFCSHCVKSVNNISAMSRKQAMRVVRKSKGGICVRFVKNPQTGAPVFAGRLYQISRRAGIAAGVLGASLSLSTLTYAQGKPVFRHPLNTEAEAAQPNQPAETKTQTLVGSLSGTIFDANGALVPNATVTIKSTGTTDGYSNTTTTDENGLYKFENIPLGTYRISATASGFKVGTADVSVLSEADNVADSVFLTNSEPSVPVLLGDVISVESENPLHRAVADNNLEEVSALITKGESVNAKDEDYDNVTPLFIAVENGNVEIAEILLNFGAKVNARDKNRQTPLMQFDEDATTDLVRALIKHGAKINLADGEGNTALILAAGEASAEVLQILIDHKADVNAQNKQGQTALMNAAEAGKLESVCALILAGADVNLKNRDGETAWDLTTDDEIEALLESHGAIVEEN